MYTDLYKTADLLIESVIWNYLRLKLTLQPKILLMRW